MLTKLRSKLSYANVISTLCLFMLLGGSAYAAATITGKDIKNSSITGKDVKRKSLTKKHFRGSVRGAPGAPGAIGPQGPAGPSVLGQLTVVRSPQVFFGPSDFAQSATAFCPPGFRVVSGGGFSISDEQVAASLATGDRSGWGVIGIDQAPTGGEYVQAQALCAPAGQAVAAAADRSRGRAQFARLEARIEAEQR